MKKRFPLREYFSRLAHQTWLLATGGIGFLVTLIAEIFFPNSFVLIIYLAIFFLGLLVGGYRVFVELLHVYEALEKELHTLENRKPEIKVGFLDKAGQLTTRLELWLNQIPGYPDFDALVEEKRIELVENRPSTRTTSLIAGSIGLSYPNPNYDQELEKYFQEYREFLVKTYECNIDRAITLQVVIENNGKYPANNVSVEFAMPVEFREPLEHHCFDRATFDKEDLDLYVWPPNEPEPYIDRRISMTRLPIHRDLASVIQHFDKQSDLIGPVIDNKDGRYFIEYSVKKLIQHHPEDEFDPLWLWLGDIKENTIWEIPVKITSADLREPDNDVLYIVMKIRE